MNTTIFFLLSILLNNNSDYYKPCIKGDIEYSVARYKNEVFIKEQYQNLFDSLLYESTYNFFCNQEIKNLPLGDTNMLHEVSPSTAVIIEPLFINLSNFDGVYGYRSYSLGKKVRVPRYSDGCHYYHYFFLISNNQYFEFDKDTLANMTLIKTNLVSSFNKEEISRMIDYYKFYTDCDRYTFHPPTYIKKGEEVVFDNGKR